MPEPSRDDGDMRLAYLVSQYPATSHTFISREVAAMRELGVSLSTFSIRPPAEVETQDNELRVESEATFTVLRQSAAAFLGAQVWALLRRPSIYFQVLASAFGHRPPRLRSFAMSFVYFAEALVLARELDRRRITWLHNHFANAGAIVGYLASRYLGLPWSFTMHGISETDYPAGLLLRKKIHSARFVGCVSYFGRAQAMRLIPPEQWAKLHVVRCGLPLGKLPSHVQSPGPPRLICVGRLSPEKGQAGLLEAFAAAAADHPDVQLVLVGDGPEAEQLHARAKALGLEQKVQFTGRLGEEDTLKQIASSDIMVLSSFMEGLPIVLMEAMAMGTAVIASRVAGIPELIRDATAGLLFTPSDWDELAECIRRLLRDEELRRSLAANGREVVAAEFDVRRSAAQLRTLFVGETVK